MFLKNDNDEDNALFLKALNHLRISVDTDVVFVAVQSKGTASGCDFYAYKKNNNLWTLDFKAEGYLGRAGVVEPEERCEGSGTSPAGIYGFGMLFGLCEAPMNLKREYKKIDEDDYWDGDCNSDTYNQYVKKSEMPEKWDYKSSEHLIDFNPAYNYAAMINFNVSPAIKGRGSAIFFHCTRPNCNASAGCICIPEEFAIKVLEMIDDNSMIIILKQPQDIKKYLK